VVDSAAISSQAAAEPTASTANGHGFGFSTLITR
jgi:hypothetical protein